MVHLVDIQINGAYVYMGLLYGGDDFLQTLNIAMRCGMDSDCTASSSVGILGTVFGMKGIPERCAILRDLPIENRVLKSIYPDLIDWDDILDATVEVAKWNKMNYSAASYGVSLGITFYSQQPAGNYLLKRFEI